LTAGDTNRGVVRGAQRWMWGSTIGSGILAVYASPERAPMRFLETAEPRQTPI
jgi:hypothetical protein